MDGGLDANALPPPVRDALATDAEVLEARWARLQAWLLDRFGKAEPGIESILFLMGIQARGRGFEPKLQKEAKQDLIMEGTYCAFEAIGLYERVGADPDGRDVWAFAGSGPLPPLAIDDQEKLLRVGILRYFDDVLPD